MYVHSVASSQVIHRGSLRIAVVQGLCHDSSGVPRGSESQNGDSVATLAAPSDCCQTIVRPLFTVFHRLLRTVRPIWCCTLTVAACGAIAMRIAMFFFKKTGFESLILFTVTRAVVDCRQDR